jgi:hypothetical protein
VTTCRPGIDETVALYGHSSGYRRLPVLSYRSPHIHSRFPYCLISTPDCTSLSTTPRRPFMGANISTINGQSAIKKMPLELWLVIVEFVSPLSLPDWRRLATIESLRWRYDMYDKGIRHGARDIGLLRLVNRAAANYLHRFQYQAVSLFLYHLRTQDEVLRQGSLPKFERVVQGHKMAHNTRVMDIDTVQPSRKS